MIGLKAFCEQHFGARLGLHQTRNCEKATRAVLTGGLHVLMVHPEDAQEPSLALAALLWTAQYGWRKLPLLVLPDSAETSSTWNLTATKAMILAGKFGINVQAEQVRTPGRGFGLTRQLEDRSVVGPDFFFLDGFTAADSSAIDKLMLPQLARSGLLLAEPALATAVAGNGWILAT